MKVSLNRLKFQFYMKLVSSTVFVGPFDVIIYHLNAKSQLNSTHGFCISHIHGKNIVKTMYSYDIRIKKFPEHKLKL